MAPPPRLREVTQISSKPVGVRPSVRLPVTPLASAHPVNEEHRYHRLRDFPLRRARPSAANTALSLRPKWRRGNESNLVFVMMMAAAR